MILVSSAWTMANAKPVPDEGIQLRPPHRRATLIEASRRSNARQDAKSRRDQAVRRSHVHFALPQKARCLA